MILQVVFTICKVRTLITFKKIFLQKEQDEFVVSKFSNLKKFSVNSWRQDTK